MVRPASQTSAGREPQGTGRNGNATFAILGGGGAVTALARASIAAGYEVVVAHPKGLDVAKAFVSDLGSRARAADATEAAQAADFAILAFPLMVADQLPTSDLVGKVVIDNRNFLGSRPDRSGVTGAGRTPILVPSLARAATLQSATPKTAKAFTHIHGRPLRSVPRDALPAVLRLGRPAGAPDRRSLILSSDHPEAVELLTRFYNDLGFDAVVCSPLTSRLMSPREAVSS